MLDNLIAQTSNSYGNFRGLGPLGLENLAGSQAPTLFNKFISTAIGIMTVVAGIFFIFLIISGAISWMGAGGDKGAIEEARKRILNGVVGLIIVIAAVFIAELIGYLFGFDFIMNPAEFIIRTGP